jgi:hypothetical protein
MELAAGIVRQDDIDDDEEEAEEEPTPPQGQVPAERRNPKAIPKGKGKAASIEPATESSSTVELVEAQEPKKKTKAKTKAKAKKSSAFVPTAQDLSSARSSDTESSKASCPPTSDEEGKSSLCTPLQLLIKLSRGRQTPPSR